VLHVQNTVPRAVTGVTFTPDGRLISGGSGGFDVTEIGGGERRFVRQPAVRDFYSFDADPWGRWLFHSTPLTGLQLFDLGTLEPARLPGSKYDHHHVISLSASGPGGRVAVSRGGAANNRIECWLVHQDTGELAEGWVLRDGQFCSPFDPFSLRRAGELAMFANRVAFDPTGSRLYVSLDHRVPQTSRPVLTVLSAATGRVENELPDCRVGFMIYHLALPDDRLVIWSTNRIEVWDTATGRQLAANAGHGRAHVTGVAAHPSGGLIASVGGDGRVRMWGVPDLAPLTTYHWDIGKLHSITFNRVGTLAAAGGDKGKVVVWDVDV
jgi:WD40 repeat protein